MALPVFSLAALEVGPYEDKAIQYEFVSFLIE